MRTFTVTYEGPKNARFDREYYRNHHLPLVKHTWGPYGMETISAFFPVDNVSTAGDGTGVVALCLCEFRDDAALHDALASPDTPKVMNDLPNFTDLESRQHVLHSMTQETR